MTPPHRLAKGATHLISRLYAAEFDFPERETPPTRRYMIATTPRSGSTNFCIELWRTGALGAPLEYVNLPNHQAEIDRVGGGDPATYWKRIQRLRTSANGVFGFKAFIPNLKRIELNQDYLLPQIWADDVIFLTRRDKVAQAVSFARAQQTGAWFAGVREKAEPAYDFELIRTTESWIHGQEESWRALFSLTGIEPLCVCYEDTLLDAGPVARRLAARLGVDPPGADPIEIPGLGKQSDEMNRAWTQRYLDERGPRAAERVDNNLDLPESSDAPAVLRPITKADLSVVKGGYDAEFDWVSPGPGISP